MGALGREIVEWQDRQWPRPSLAQIGEKMRPPVARSTVAKWMAGTPPSPENLRALSVVLADVPYWRLVDAMLVDAGYLEDKGERPLRG